jgi:hypothetical protein
MDQANQFSDLVIQLSERYPRFRPVTIERLVTRTAEQYRGARITAFVQILVERQVREQLQYVDAVPDRDLDESPAQAAS